MIEIKYPPRDEIEKCKKTVVEAAVMRKKIRRPGLKTVFHGCGSAGFISILIYALLWWLCMGLKNTDPLSSGLAILGIYPLSYFSFSFLSIFSEEQSETVELKSSLRFPYFYIVALRTLYASVAAVFMNLALMAAVFRHLNGVWSLCAAGTAFTVILALLSMKIYQKFGSSTAICALPALWAAVCALSAGSEKGAMIFNRFINIVPLAVHILVAAASIAGIILYVGKVETRYADC